MHQMLSSLPSPAERNIALRVSPAAERALRNGHPWLYEGAIRHQSHEGRPGDLAVIFDAQRRFMAVGLYDPGSAIRVRILQHRTPATIDGDWFRTRLAAADQLRQPLRDLPSERATTGYRLIHGENDGLPGLVIDLYGQAAVIKLYTSAWLPHLAKALLALEEIRPGKRLVLRLARSLQERPEALHGLYDGMRLSGPELSEPVLFYENGLCFEVDPVQGQKTGFFLDQRDNRARVEALSDGRSVLNLFAYTGGFSVYAARGGAREVVSLDASAPALDAALRNMEHNRSIPAVAAAVHQTMTADAFGALAEMGRAGRLFDMVIVDPPAFAQKRSQVPQALAAYARLTRLALGVLRPGGTLVQASCSSQVDAETFYETVQRGAAEAGRPLRELERTGHALDHPVGFREGAYLKCLFAAAS